MKKRKHDDASLSCSLIRRPIQRWGWLFLLPTFAAFCVGFLYPFAKGLFLSFCKFKTTSKWTWVGLKNYQTIFQDDGFLHAFWYTALFALVSLLIINVLAFAVAYVLTKGIKGSNIFRTVFFMPNLIGGIVLGYIVSAIANQVLFLADSSKFERIARLKITDLKPEYTLITDSSLPEEMLRFYQNSGISIMKGES